MRVERRAGKKLAVLVLCVMFMLSILTGCDLLFSVDNHEYKYIASAQQLFNVMNDALYQFEETVYVRTKTYTDFQSMWKELDESYSMHTCFREKSFLVEHKDKDYYCNIIISMPLNSTGEAMQVLYAKNRKDYKTEEARRFGEKLMSVKNQIISDSMTEVQIVMKVHDYIISNYSYAVNGSIESFAKASVLLENGMGQCQAYSELFVCLCLLSGVKAQVVTGHSTFGHGEVGHAWNIVQIDSSWYHVDVTWDDPIPDVPGLIHYDYFLKGDYSLRESHEWSEFFENCYGDYVS